MQGRVSLGSERPNDNALRPPDLRIDIRSGTVVRHTSLPAAHRRARRAHSSRISTSGSCVVKKT
jgi:hypothetical protein